MDNFLVDGVNSKKVFVAVVIGNNVIAMHTGVNGTYAFIGIPECSYSLKVELENGTVSTESVTVGGTNTANCNFVLN